MKRMPAGLWDLWLAFSELEPESGPQRDLRAAYIATMARAAGTRAELPGVPEIFPSLKARRRRPSQAALKLKIETMMAAWGTGPAGVTP